MRAVFSTFAVLCVLGASACTTAYKKTIGGEPPTYLSRIYLTDFNTGWQAILDALKHSPLDVSNREGGFVQTKWTDNTAERNFVEAFGNQDVNLRAQYRFRVSIAKGFYNGQGSVRIQVYKEQLVERDVLEGWKPVLDDQERTDENTLLYRIGRLIYMKMKLALLEEQKASSGAPVGGEPPPPVDTAPPTPGSSDVTKELELLESQ